MSKPILEQEFWRRRLQDAEATQQRWQAIYHTTQAEWDAIAHRHRVLLRRHIGHADSILDAGCGYGRLLGLLPAAWRGHYLGIDLFDGFIDIARKEFSGHTFICGDLTVELPLLPDKAFTWAVCASMRAMIIGNVGEAYWAGIQAELLRVAGRLLLLEYRTDDHGEVIE